MILKSDEAYELLMVAKELNPAGYISHSIKVGEAAGRIAKALNLDVDKAIAMGYIHDIGKRFGEPLNAHVAKGYEYIKSLGYDDEFADVCLTHSYLNNDIGCTAGGIVSPKSYKYEFRKEFMKNHKCTIYDKIIQLCDLMCAKDFMILEERLIEIMTRRGAYNNTQYHITEAIKHKQEIEKLLGKSIYTLFPEIVSRLLWKSE